MSTTADSIIGTALALPANDRARIAAELIASLDEGQDADVETAWAAEIDRRISEIESGEVETASWEQARARIRSKLAKS